jgi:hypothetical protein
MQANQTNMKPIAKKTGTLKKKLQKVIETPAGFAFFVAIHDFVEHIELYASSAGLPVKYSQLKQIHQGIKDTKVHSEKDLGHERYMTIQDLTRIQKQELSDSNPLWKKREVLRSLSVEVYERIEAKATASGK